MSLRKSPGTILYIAVNAGKHFGLVVRPQGNKVSSLRPFQVYDQHLLYMVGLKGVYYCTGVALSRMIVASPMRSPLFDWFGHIHEYRPGPSLYL